MSPQPPDIRNPDVGKGGEGLAAAEARRPAPSGWHFGIRLPGRRYYLNVRFGAEQRSPRRLRDEGQIEIPVAMTAYLTAGSVLLCLFGMICSLYLMKSMLGIDLFTGPSPLHPLYALIFE